MEEHLSHDGRKRLMVQFRDEKLVQAEFKIQNVGVRN